MTMPSVHSSQNLVFEKNDAWIINETVEKDWLDKKTQQWIIR